ncbi:MAG TPA: DUF2520 domain-containing protein [Thermoanaerobaculia bacterium]|nr:DUF2520 domain-containing protein [Thermoanaerobaculia bacterium]
MSRGGALAELSLTLVGPGRVGTSLALWAVAAGASLAAVARRRPDQLLHPLLAARVGAVTPLAELASAGQDLLLLAVPDAAVGTVAAQLANRGQARVALHTAGALDAEALAPLRRAGSAVGGLHPLRAFPGALPDPALAAATFFALQGDRAALRLGHALAAAWGATAAEVAADHRPLYHLAATLAAGGVTTLAAAAAGVAGAVGLPREVAGGYLELARGALALADPGEPAAAITGPAARGDSRYLDQLAALRRHQPRLHPLVVLLALESLHRLQRGAPLSAAQEHLRRALLDLCRDPQFLHPLFG